MCRVSSNFVMSLCLAVMTDNRTSLVCGKHQALALFLIAHCKGQTLLSEISQYVFLSRGFLVILQLLLWESYKNALKTEQTFCRGLTPASN